MPEIPPAALFSWRLQKQVGNWQLQRSEISLFKNVDLL